MYFARKRLIGKFIGVATAAFLVLAMMPGLAWGVETSEVSLPQEALTASVSADAGTDVTAESNVPSVATEEAPQSFITDSEDLSDSTVTEDSSLPTESANEEVTSSTSLDSITTDSLDQQIREQVALNNLPPNDPIKKEVSIDGVAYSDAQTAAEAVRIGPGGALTYKLYFKDQGTTDLEGVTVTDDLPEGFEYVSPTAQFGGQEPEVVGQQLRWANIIVPHDANTVTYQVMASNIPTSNPANPYVNTAKADKPSVSEDTAKVIVTKDELTIDKRVSTDGQNYIDSVTVGPGDKVYFKIVVANNDAESSYDAGALRVDDYLPTGFTLLDDTSKINGATVAPDQAGTPNWTINKAVGAKGSAASETSYSDTVTLEFQARASSIPSVVSYVNVSQLVKTGEAPVYFASDTAEVSVGSSLTKQVSVGGSAFADEAKVKQGEKVTYKIVVANPGAGNISGIKVKDALPTGFTYVSSSTEITDSDGVKTKDATTDPKVEGQLLTWPKDTATTLTVKAGKTLILTYDVTASKVVSQSAYENKGEAFQGESQEPFSFDATKVTVVLKEVKKQVSTDGTTYSDEVSVATNATVYYKITVTNADPANEIVLGIEDTLPTGFTYQTGTTSGVTTNNPAINGQKLTWSPITAAKATAADKPTDTVLTFRAKAGSSVGDSNVNTVKVLKDTTFELGTDTANVKVAGTPGLGITKTVDKSTASPNDTLTYIITYQNTGNVQLTSVVVTDGIPTGTTYVAASVTAGGIFNQAANALTWTVGSLNASASGSVSFKATVNADATGTITNTATIDSDQTDPKTASASTTAVVVLATTQQPATLPGETESQLATAQQLPTTLPKTGLDLLGYLFGAAMLVSSGLFLRRLGQDKR